MGPVLVTGGTGFIGRHVVNELTKKHPDLEVCVFTRKPRGTPGVTELIGDITDPVSTEKALASRSGEWEAIIHLAGLIAYSNAASKDLQAVNVGGTRNVMFAMTKHAAKARLCYMSSVAAVGANTLITDEPLSESSPWDASWGHQVGYIRTKRAAERLVMDISDEKGLDVVILCPSQVYGYGDAIKSSRKTQVKVAKGKWPFYTNGGTNIVSLDACVDVILRVAVEKVGVARQRYIIAGENVSIQGMMEMYSKVADQPAPRWCFPGWLLWIFCFAGELFGSSSFTRDRAAVALRYHWFDSTRAQKALGLKVEPAEEVIARSVQYMHDKNLI